MRIDIAAPSFKADPSVALAASRAAGPLAELRLPFIGAVALTTTCAGAEAVLKDQETFRMRARPDLAPVPWWAPRTIRLLADNMLLRDDPEHRRLRRLVDTAFQRREIAELAPKIDAAADRLLDGIAASGGGFDVVARFARPLPLIVISDLLGLPETDREKFVAWGDAITSAGSPLGFWRALGGLRRLIGYLDNEIETVRRAPRLGLLSALVEVEAEGDRLSRDELVAMAITLLMAGHETTTHLIAGGAWALIAHPEARAAFRSDPAAGVEELLRWLSPVMVSKPRIAARDVRIEGAPVKKGARVMASLIHANHDPARFAAPERLDLARRPTGHLAFGAGVHFCLGLQLARAEAATGLAKLFERFPALAEESPPAWSAKPGMRSAAAYRLTP